MNSIDPYGGVDQPRETGASPAKREPALLPFDPPAPGGLRLQHLMLGVILAAFLLWVGIIAGLWLFTGSLVLLASCVIGIAVVVARRGSTQQESLLWALAIAAERGMPLAPAALAFADQYSGGYRWRVRLLANLLEEGRTLPEAVEEVPGLVGGEARVLIRTGDATGALAESLREAANLRNARQAVWGSVAGGFAYLAMAAFVMQVIFGFIMYFIIPKYQAIFADFGVELPALTRSTIQFSHAVAGYGGLPLLLLVLIELVTLLALPMGLFRGVDHNMPLIDWIFRRRHTALVLRALALSVSSQRPIEANIERISEDYPSGWVRRRLRKVSQAVQNGREWTSALQTHGLLSSSEAAVLASAQRAGNLAWALHEVASSTERRLGYRLQLGLQMAFPFVILLMGGVVGILAVAYFLPLITLIGRLA
ncbi:MAG: type II secretion system F family protein [Isosphaeraceae bacterium]